MTADEVIATPAASAAPDGENSRAPPATARARSGSVAARRIQPPKPAASATTPSAAVAGATPLEHNGYKVPLVRGLIEEVLGGIPPV